MVAEVERGGVHPQRPAQPTPGHVEQLPEPGHQVQPGRDHVPHGLDPEPTARVEQAAPSRMAKAPISCGQISSGHSISWSSAVSLSTGITPGFPASVGHQAGRGPGTFGPAGRAGRLFSPSHIQAASS